MKLDDRMMTVFTALLLLVGIGAILQRGENGASIFGGDGSYSGNPDSFALRAGRVQSLDVLLNDKNADAIDASELKIVEAPNCGFAAPVAGAIQYSESASCSGDVAMSYCVPWEGDCKTVPITLTIVPAEGGLAVAGEDGSPAIVVSVAQGMSPEEQSPQFSMARPLRLTLPSTAEVLTPSEATAEVRRIGQEGTSITVADANNTDSSVNVSRGSARSGSVSVIGTSMSAPDLGGQDAGIAMAAATDATPQARPGRPTTLSPLPQQGFAPAPAPNAQPSAPSPSSRPAAPASQLAEAPGGVTAPAAPDQGAPITGITQLPIVGTAPAEAPVAVPQPVEAPTVVAGIEPPQPQQEQPFQLSALQPSAPVVANPQTQPSFNAQPTVQTQPQVAPQPAAQPETVEVAPDAQVIEPTAAEAPINAAPNDSGVLASLVRSNTVFGATVSAAKALFAPSEPQAEVAQIPSNTSAPRPRETALVSELGLAAEVAEETSVDLGVGSGDRGPSRVQTSAPVVVASIDTSTDSFVLRTAPAQPAKAPEAAQVEAPVGETVAAGDAPAPAEDAQPETEVAALAPDAGLAEAPRVSLNLPQLAPSGSEGAVSCNIDLSLQVSAGAELVASLSSPCRPEQQFLVEHAGLVFTAETDLDGVANFVVPALTTNAIVSVSFPDGGSAVDRETVEGMSNMTRVGVVWTDTIDLNLHTSEFNAKPDSENYIWAENARDYRLARRSGGGYLTQLGPVEGEGVRAEVYTIFQTIRTKNGVVDFDLKVADATACAIAPVIRVLRSEQSELVRNTDLQVDLASCEADQVLGVEFGLQDIQIADAR